MITRHKALLEKKIEEFIVAICEEDDVEYPAYIYDTLIEDMANVAECLFDASMQAQVFCRENN